MTQFFGDLYELLYSHHGRTQQPGRHIMTEAPASPIADDLAVRDVEAPASGSEQTSSAMRDGHPAPSSSRPALVTISRSVIPPSMSYDAYIIVYRSLLGWVKQLALSPSGHPATAAELAFLSDHRNLQR